jgi:protein TonB
MLTVALLALFTLLCVLLSADRAWDNVTKPERNALVFDGRNRAYGAFVLRREYDRRFIWAFTGALGLLGTAAALPKLAAALGWYASQPTGAATKPWIDVIMNVDPSDPPKPPDDPQTSHTAAATAPTNPNDLDRTVVPTDTAVVTTPEDTTTTDPVLPNPGPVGPPSTGPAGNPGLTGDNDSTVFTVDSPLNSGNVDIIPEFPGGQAAMARFIRDNLRVNNEEITLARAQVVFVIDTDGSVVRVKSRGKAVKEFCDAAERVVRAMPKWKPAKYKGRDVPCVMVLPIEYQTQ